MSCHGRSHWRCFCTQTQGLLRAGGCNDTDEMLIDKLCNESAEPWNSHHSSAHGRGLHPMVMTKQNK
eukprot:6136722-Karenia_brevis.AAC.1